MPLGESRSSSFVAYSVVNGYIAALAAVALVILALESRFGFCVALFASGDLADWLEKISMRFSFWEDDWCKG